MRCLLPSSARLGWSTTSSSWGTPAPPMSYRHTSCHMYCYASVHALHIVVHRSLPVQAGACQYVRLHVNTYWRMIAHATACHRMPPHATTCSRMLPHATACHRMPPHATACHRMLPHAPACYRMPHHAGTCQYKGSYSCHWLHRPCLATQLLPLPRPLPTASSMPAPLPTASSIPDHY